jgi:hypothetical protein
MIWQCPLPGPSGTVPATQAGPRAMGWPRAEMRCPAPFGLGGRDSALPCRLLAGARPGSDRRSPAPHLRAPLASNRACQRHSADSGSHRRHWQAQHCARSAGPRPKETRARACQWAQPVQSGVPRLARSTPRRARGAWPTETSSLSGQATLAAGPGGARAGGTTTACGDVSLNIELRDILAALELQARVEVHAVRRMHHVLHRPRPALGSVHGSLARKRQRQSARAQGDCVCERTCACARAAVPRKGERAGMRKQRPLWERKG